MIISKALKVLLYYTSLYENQAIDFTSVNKNDMTKVQTFVKTEIIHDDKIGCTEEYIRFSKQLLQLKFNVEYDHVTFRCYTVIDDKGVRHTKRYKEVKIPT